MAIMKAKVAAACFQLAMRMPMMATDLGQLFKNAQVKAEDWGGSFIGFMGIICAIVGVVILLVGLINHGKKPVPWLMCIVMILLGLFFAAKGFAGVKVIENVGVGTLEELTNGAGG